MRRIVIVLLGEVNVKAVNYLIEVLEKRFPWHVIVEKGEPEPTYARDSERCQYQAVTILERLKSERSKNDIVLGITTVDLFSGNYNYIFGQAELLGDVAVISTYRLEPAKPLSAERLFFQRLEKEVIHELGHILGLKHCQKGDCVMHLSNDISDTDYKNSEFCLTCQFQLNGRLRAV